MKNIIYPLIVLLLLSCNTTKETEKKEKKYENNPLENTCWAIDYRIKNNGDSIKMELKINLEFKENGFCNISGMKSSYKLKDSILSMEGNTYKIISLSKKELKLAEYWGEYLTSYELYHRIHCDSVNEIFKGVDKF